MIVIVSPLLFWVGFENRMMCFKFNRSCVWKTHSNKTNFTSVDGGKVDDNDDPFGIGFHTLEACRHGCSRNDMAVKQNQRKSDKPGLHSLNLKSLHQECRDATLTLPAKIPRPTFQGDMFYSLPIHDDIIPWPPKMMWFVATSPRGDRNGAVNPDLFAHSLPPNLWDTAGNRCWTNVGLPPGGSIRWSSLRRRWLENVISLVRKPSWNKKYSNLFYNLRWHYDLHHDITIIYSPGCLSEEFHVWTIIVSNFRFPDMLVAFWVYVLPTYRVLPTF